MSSPYRIDGPAIVSFSGGRTSGFMLRQILDAHGGTLPDDVVVCFANTGLEHPATLDFVNEVGLRWCPVAWLEYQTDAPRFRRVDYTNASRNGEPFTQIMSERSCTPNPRVRYCTSELKIRTMKRFTRSLGWDEYTSVVGLRADESRRVANIRGDIKAETVVCPMARAGHTLDDVLAFWKAQPFDLSLPMGNNSYGNCVGCFLKGINKIRMIATDAPEHLEWWVEAEAKAGETFRIDRPSYKGIMAEVRIQGRLFQEGSDDTLPCMCTE